MTSMDVAAEMLEMQREREQAAMASADDDREDRERWAQFMAAAIAGPHRAVPSADLADAALAAYRMRFPRVAP